jgi:hypothetical protein
MPIVGPVNTGSTTVLGSTTFVETAVPDCTITRHLPTAEGGPGQWYHSTVLVIPFGTSTAIEDHRVPDLTTLYTPSPSCIDRWMLEAEPSDCGLDNPRTGNFTVYSVNPSRSIVSDASYSSCQAYGKASYSPGICPSGQTVAEITAYQSNVSTGYRTFWQASCCQRFVYATSSKAPHAHTDMVSIAA